MGKVCMGGVSRCSGWGAPGVLGGSFGVLGWVYEMVVGGWWEGDGRSWEVVEDWCN